MSSTVIFIDFDGVICNSADECLVSSWIGYYRYHLKTEPSHVSVSLRTRFMRYRPFIRSGDDYLLIQELIDHGTEIKDNKQFDIQRGLAGREKMNAYKNYFYKARDYLLKTDHAYWLELHTIFPFLTEPLKKASKKENIHILSTKKEKYIIETLGYYSINISPERVHYSSNSDKIFFIKSFLKASAYTSAVLIDDQIDNLKENTESYITTYIALWGFIDKKWLIQYPSIKTLDRDEMVRLLTLA